jgi:hypothetical protein
MIGSLMSRMADAEKLSIPQLNQAVKNGTIPAYVGVPLIQEKMKAEQAAKAMVAQTQAQPPLARQVMEQADVMSGLEKLQSNLPEEGYAGGGIIAFAEGGVSLPDEDEDEEKNLMSRLMAGITSLKQGVSDRIPSSDAIKQSIVNKLPSSMRTAASDGPQKGDYVSPPAERRARGNHKYENMVAQEAERIGLDPNIAVHALYKETGNLKNPESARSRAGALGVMQLMPRTAKELGVDPLNPEENIRGGVMYLKKMYDKYQDPTLALAAYNAGPGRVDRALRSGQGISSLPRETQNYVMARNMAEGGIVAFQTGGVSGEFGGEGAGESFASMSYDPYFAKDPMTGEVVPSGYRRNVPETGLPKGVDPAAIIRKGSAAPAEKKPEFNFPPQGGIGPTDIELGRGATTTPTTTAPSLEDYKEPPVDGGLSDIKNLLKQRMEESGKQKRIDTYLSLLQAGLGMMGGTSPYAAVNIGQGASTGVAAQMAARKAQVADENAILTGQLGLSRAELYDKMRRDALRQKAEETKFSQGLRERQLGVNAQRANEMVRANQLKLGDLRRKATQDWDNSPDKARIEKDLAGQKKNWRQDSKLLGQYEMIRNRFINEFVNIGQEDNTPNASQL